MLLALDLGTKIGWVKGNPVGPMAHGVISLIDTPDLGLWLASSDDGLREAMRGATAIAMEQPFMGDNWLPLRKLTALLGHVHYFAHNYGIKIDQKSCEIPVSTGKLTLSGHGNAEKKQMIAAALARTGLVLGEHEADALGIWWVWQFGSATPIRKARVRSGKGVSVKDA